MARLIAVSIDCRNEAIRRNFEEIVSQRRDYLIARGKGTGTADMVLLDLDELRPQQTFAHIRELLGAAPNLEVFLTATRTDPQILLEAFRIGVKEFLPQPLTRQEVEPALARFEERFSVRAPESGRQPGRVVCVIGARGGVGTSTVAVNLAAAVQQNIQRESAVLMDLDLHGGELGLFLDLHASQGLKQLSTDLSRLDETILLSSLMKHGSNLNFLASGHEGFADIGAAPGSAMRVVGLLRSLYPHLLIDCGHILEPTVREALDCADRIIVVKPVPPWSSAWNPASGRFRHYTAERFSFIPALKVGIDKPNSDTFFPVLFTMLVSNIAGSPIRRPTSWANHWPMTVFGASVTTGFP